MSRTTARDSVTIDADSCDSEIPTGKLTMGSMKLFMILFMIFMFVVSDCFTDSVIASFGNSAVHGRDLTTWGVSLQGIFLVLFYIIAIYLNETKII